MAAVGGLFGGGGQIADVGAGRGFCYGEGDALAAGEDFGEDAGLQGFGGECADGRGANGLSVYHGLVN